MPLTDLLIAPDPAAWRAALEPRRTDPRAARFRASIGLPVDRPVILSGHQAAVWHAGIAAKWLAVGHAGARLGAAAAWVVVDQDPEDFSSLRLPVRVPISGGGTAVRAAEWAITSDEVKAMLRAGRPPGAMGPFPVRPAPAARDLGGAGAEFARPGIGVAARMLAASLDAAGRATATAAEQLTAAVAGRLAALAPTPAVVSAMRLARTDLFGELVDRMLDDPRRCVETYNAAASRRPHAGIAPLAQAAGRWELPLWHVPPAGAPDRARRRVWADALPALPRDQLAPRALLLTGVLRLAGCDLFVHGLGGAGRDGASGYDAVTTEWMAAWLGERLAPTATVSATVLLPLQEQERPVPSPEEVARAAWRAHRARHDPAMLGRADLVETKRSLLCQIEAADDRRARADAFARMHALLRAARQAPPAAERLRSAEADAAESRRRVREGAVLVDRTWPFVLHEPADLAALADRLDGAFAPP